MAQGTTLDDTLHWFKDAVIYELHIKAFRDSNGDGIGDFNGLLQKLDYLEDLGVTAIWVLPFYPSPLKDDGYDIADYYSINTSYGDIAQFKQFLEEAHKRNLKVITELVINHTSDQHPWFQRARNAPKGSQERDYYVWTDDPTRYKDVRIIFQDYEKSNWTWDPVAQQYYWHRFFHHQPDLNYDSPLIAEEVFKVLDYWCAMGVDGFRLDAIPYLFEREDTNGENLPETHVFLKKLRAHVDAHYPGTVLLAEANMWPEDSASYFGDGDECHMNYHFPVMPRMFMAMQMEDRYPITDIFDQTPDIPETCQWAIFLRNHDELTLEMVTDEERDYMYKVYAKDPKAKINLGIRHRLAPLMENDRRKIELLNCLLFSLAGTPVIYYGDEIGMGDNFYLGDRDGVRTPMQWSPDRNAGFSEANPQKLYLPVILDPEYQYGSVNVETQRRNTTSLFWFMKRMISLRKKYRSFGRGDMKFINVDNPKVLAFTRTYGNETMLVVVNLSRYSQAAELDLSAFKGHLPVEVVSKNRFPPVKESATYFLSLGAYAYQWFTMQKVHPEANKIDALPALQMNTWEKLVSNRTLEDLTINVLPGYLAKTNWFIGRGRTIYNIAVTESFSMPFADGSSAFFLLLEVTYQSGMPELYLLPVAFVKEKFARKLNETSPQAVICKITIGDSEGYLCDAFYTRELQVALLRHLAGLQPLTAGSGYLHFEGSETLKSYGEAETELQSRVLQVEDTHTSIGYESSLFLKMYRKVERSAHPDVELTRFLTKQARLTSVPDLLGTIEWRTGKEVMTLGIMQVMAEDHGNGKAYMLERLNTFNERLLSAGKETPVAVEIAGTLTAPLAYTDLPQELQELLGGPLIEGVRLLGVRTGEMHKALASGTNVEDFRPEPFSLHYQRSLYAGMLTLVRSTFQNQATNLLKLSEEDREEATRVFDRRDEILGVLKRIYAKKFDIVKIRIHGNYHLRKVLYTGKDLAILDFSGDPTRSFSERRLKRSPLRDVAEMIRSFHYVAYESLLRDNVIADDLKNLRPYAEMWTHYVSGFFMQAYLETTAGCPFMPQDNADLNTLLETYMLEKAVYMLNFELNYRPERAIVPVRIISSILDKQQ